MSIEVEQITETKYRATARLYLNADATKVVPEDDPEAASLFASVGKEISAADVEKYGLGKGAKAKAPTDDKAVAGPAENKSARKR